MRIGIDLGGTKIAGIVLDDAGTALLARRVPTPIVAGYAAVTDAIVSLIASLEADVGATCSIGIGTPGQVSRRHGTIKNSNATCLNDQPLQQDLERLLGRGIRLANDANCFTLSEAIDGAGKAFDVVFGVIIGTGVGGGLSMGRNIVPGRHGIAGEWGHLPLEADGVPCYCGRTGCIETFLSGQGLLRAYRQSGGRCAHDAAQVAHLASHGQDSAAVHAVERYTQRLGRALAVIVSVLDPDAIVLGGGLSNIHSLYAEGRRHMRPHVFNDELDVPLLRHIHGDASGVRGAAMLWPANRRKRRAMVAGHRDAEATRRRLEPLLGS